MDRQEYLNQISAKNSTKPQGKLARFFSSKFALVGVIGVAVFIVLAVIGSVLGGSRGNVKDKSFALKLHLDNTIKVMDTYQPKVKSSKLRSSSASMYSVLSNTSRDLTSYVTSKFSFKAKNVDKKITEQAQLEMNGLSNSLFEAKITGVLDRVYAHKMAYEISRFMTEEASIINMSGDSALKELLTTSYNSLNNLYSSFNDFSETK